MDTKYEDLLKQISQSTNNPYASGLAQARMTAREVKMQRQMYEAQARQKAMEYEAMAKAQANAITQKLAEGAYPSFSRGTALTEDNLVREIDRMREENEKAKKAEDKKKRQKNANTLEKLLRHEFQTTKT